MKRRDFFKVVGAGASLGLPFSVKAELLPETTAELYRWMGERFATCKGPVGPTCIKDVNERAQKVGFFGGGHNSATYVTYRFAKEGRGNQRELVRAFAQEVVNALEESPELKGSTLIWRVRPQYRIEDAEYVTEVVDEHGDFSDIKVVKTMSVLRMRFCLPSHGRALLPEAEDGLVKYV